MKEVARPSFSVGWIDSSIHDVVARLPLTPPRSLTYALITSLDSSTELASVWHSSRHLAALRDDAVPVGSAILIQTRKLLNASREARLFFGYDEIWFFPARPSSPPPASGTLVGPHRVATLGKPLRNWLVRSGCSLGLGDGTGLNFCVRASGAAQALLAAFSAIASGAASDRQIA
jgi:hypothetical protein